MGIIALLRVDFFVYLLKKLIPADATESPNKPTIISVIYSELRITTVYFC
jgi:hypothetical protein